MNLYDLTWAGYRHVPEQGKVEVVSPHAGQGAGGGGPARKRKEKV